MGTYSHAFATAVLSLLPGQGRQRDAQARDAAAAAALTAAGLAELLLMSHHPAITAGVAKREVAWHLATKRLGCVQAALRGV